MFIRIQFDENSDKTQQILLGSPSGTCLDSTNNLNMTSREFYTKNKLVCFWYLDTDILQKYYGGIDNSIKDLKSYPDVISVDILPIDGNPHEFNIDNIKELQNSLYTCMNDI